MEEHKVSILLVSLPEVWVLAGSLVFEPFSIWCATFVRHLGACEFGVVVPAFDVHHGAFWTLAGDLMFEP